MDQAVLRHGEQIENCNQRGGRMLSVVDLIEAGTLTRELAAYALACIGGGASFLVGALPGGAGKTTVMGALLNFVPADVELLPADGMAAIESGMRAGPRRCYICHEIGSGHYYAYLWGPELRAYFGLLETGHVLATNLHADTYEQAREQIVRTNGVADALLRRMNLMFFLSVRRGTGGTQRRIVAAWESDGASPHRQVFSGETPTFMQPSAIASAQQIAQARQVMDALVASGARTIEEVRAYLVGRAGR